MDPNPKSLHSSQTSPRRAGPGAIQLDGRPEADSLVESDHKVNVLLVDDLPENLMALEAILDDFAYHLVRATSGEEALRWLLKEDFALILLDVQMPGLNGFETATIIKSREKSRSIPIIFLTALSKEDCFVFNGYSVGAVDYLFKPFDPDILRAKVRVFADLFRKDRALVAHAEELAQRTHELERANEELRSADRYKDEFLSVLSHELRTPLNFIMGFASILKDEVAGPQTELQQSYLAKILNGTDRMLLLVNDLLDFAKLRSGKFRLAPEWVDYNTLLEEVRATLEPLAAEKHQTLETDVQVVQAIYVDSNRLVQILSNLIDNAVKFTPFGGTVRVRASIADDMLLTEVTDTGVGIAPADIPKLFTRFHQLDMGSTRSASGLGLGLSISKALIEAHGGVVGVRSEPGHGSTFWFSLPLKPREPLE